MSTAISREAFREGVFKRDKFICVFCSNPAKDAHHILERRLWLDGGYHIDNGISVCEEHHFACETTAISVEEARQAANIKKKIIPEHLYDDEVYDKWGNNILPSGQRLRGELFFDESVQKVLKVGGFLDLFTNRVKYPRTYHLPWSEGANDDDRTLLTCNHFLNKEVVITEKMDGENTTGYSDGYIHARSIDGRSHSSRAWVKNFLASRLHDMPEDWRLCGENLFAKHSIGYAELPSYFMGFSLWEKNLCLGWNETEYWFALLNIPSVPVLYRGIFDEKEIRKCYDSKHWEYTEGYVVRLASDFTYGSFRKSVAKFVRKNHVQTVKHWMHGQAIESNKLIKGN